MITDWVEEEDLKSFLRDRKLPMHRRIRARTASCWIFYSKTADIYSATIKYREQKSGRNIHYITPNKSMESVIIEAIFEIELHYA